MRYNTLPFTLRQLQYACAVAETLNFRRAAERCAVSQPSLSAQIAELERMLGVQLFERGKRSTRLTPAGEAIIARARAALLTAEDLLQVVERHLDPLEGLLRLGIIPTMGPYLLPDLDPALRSAFPELRLRWVEDKTAALVAQLEAGALDGAVMALEADIGDLAYEVIGRDELRLATPRGHALSRGRGRVKAEQLDGQQVLLLDDGHCFRDQALALCARAGASERDFRATSLPTLVQMALGGGELTLLPQMAVEVENRRGQLTLRRFRDPAPARTVILAWRRASPLAEALGEVSAVARGACSARVEADED